MQIYEINAKRRVGAGKGACRRLRRAGMVPGILYGAGRPPQPIQIDGNELALHLQHEVFYSHVLTVRLEDLAERVVLKDLQRHPYKPVILHVDFQRIDEGKKLTIRVPLHFVNEARCVGVKGQGGVLSHLASELEVECLPKDLPEYLEVDVEALQVGDTLHAADLKLPPGVELAEDPARPLVSCHLPRVTAEEAQAPAAGEAAAAPAAAQGAEPKAEAKPAAKPEARK